MKLFDPRIYSLHQQRAMGSFNEYAFLFNHVGTELTSRLEDIKKKFNKVLNLSPHPLPFPAQQHPTLEEALPFTEKSFDLILSCLQLHWVNNLPGLLKSLYSCLQDDGLFLGSLWGGNTLFELRDSFLQAELALTAGASPRISPMLHPADASPLLKGGGFFMPVIDTETIKVTYPSLPLLLRDLKGMGETNALYDRSKGFTSRTLFKKTEEIYRETYGQLDGALPATFEVIYLTGWRG